MMKGCVLIYEIDFTQGEKIVLSIYESKSIQSTEQHLSNEHPCYVDAFY